MKTISLLLLAMVSCAAGAGQATATYQYTCKSSNGKCPPAPVAPVAPVPPVPPAPPAPPVPPAPPPLPVIPAEAHKACAGKSAGTTLNYVIRKGETMTGTCEKGNSQMVFVLRSYSIED